MFDGHPRRFEFECAKQGPIYVTRRRQLPQAPTDYQAPDPSTKTKAVGTLNGNDVLRLVKRRLKDAGLPPETFTPHSFRAATATSLRKKDVPRDHVQYLLGHADSRTTALYDHSEEEDAHEIVDQITL